MTEPDSLTARLRQVMPGNVVAPIQPPQSRAEGSMDDGQVVTYSALQGYLRQINHHDEARGKLIVALIGGTVALLTAWYRLPALWEVWVCAAFFGIYICIDRDAYRCCEMIRFRNLGYAAEERFRDKESTLFDKLDLRFNRFNFSVVGWFGFAAFIIWLLVAAYSKVAGL